MTARRAGPMLAALLAATATAPACVENGSVVPLELDYDEFVSSVNPVLAAGCALTDCHGLPDRPLRLYARNRLRAGDFEPCSTDADCRAGFDCVPEQEYCLAPYMLRNGLITDEELRANFDRARSLAVLPAEDSLLLSKPLAMSAGGAFHNVESPWDDEDVVYDIFADTGDPGYEVIRAWIAGEEPPAGVTGNIVVADEMLGVIELTSDGELARTLGDVVEPLGLTIDGRGAWVGTAGARLYRIDLGTGGQQLVAEGLGGAVRGVAIAGDEILITVRSATAAGVVVLDRDGVFLSEMGAGVLTDPWDLVVVDGRVMVADGSANQVLAFGATGALTVVLAPGEVAMPIGLAVRAGGTLLVASPLDALQEVALQPDGTGVLLGRFDPGGGIEPVDVIELAGGDVLAPSQPVILRFGADGSNGGIFNMPGTLDTPMSIAEVP